MSATDIVFPDGDPWGMVVEEQQVALNAVIDFVTEPGDSFGELILEIPVPSAGATDYGYFG
jgi:hypothetical protein